MVTADEMRSIMGAIWEGLSGGGLPELPTADDLHQARDGAALEGRPRLVGRVEITGEWEGAVTIDCEAELAARIAGAMFGVPGGTSEPEEIHDALGELANMAGGNLKSLLPAPSRLSLPTVSHESGPRRGPSALHAVGFDVAGMRIVLSLLPPADA